MRKNLFDTAICYLQLIIKKTEEDIKPLIKRGSIKEEENYKKSVVDKNLLRSLNTKLKSCVINANTSFKTC